MSAKRARLDVGGGGLYDFLPTAAEEEVVVVQRAKTLAPAKEDRSKVIFLDVDGVLRPEGECERVIVDGELVPVLPKNDDGHFTKTALLALRSIVERTGATMVLSSEWRRAEVMRNAVGIVLRSHGLPQVIACTTTTLKQRPELVKANKTIAFAERRAREIGEWLQRHPDVTSWVAIDDVDLSWGDGVRAKDTPLMKSRVARTNAEKCLSEENALEAIRILTNPPVFTPEEEAGIARRAARKIHAAFPHLKNGGTVAESISGPRAIPRRQGY